MLNSKYYYLLYTPACATPLMMTSDGFALMHDWGHFLKFILVELTSNLILSSNM